MAKIHSGGSLEGKLPESTLGGSLVEVMTNFGTKTALVNASQGTSHTYEQVLNISKSVASGLQSWGLQAGDVVTFYSTNTDQFIFMLLGALRLNLIVNTLNPASTSYELKHHLKQVQPTLIFTESELVKTVEESVSVVNQKPDILMSKRYKSYPDIYDVCKYADGSNVTAHISRESTGSPTQDDTAIILFSSGTTGLPKGVMLSHRNVLTHMYLRTHYSEKFGGCRISVFPMYHAAGLISGLLCSLLTGSKLVFLEKYNFQLLLESIDKYKPDHIYIPPPIIVQMAKSPLTEKYDTSSLRECNTGAAPVKSETEKQFLKKFNIRALKQGYGLTETTSGFMWTHDEGAHGSSGRVVEGVEAKIIEPGTGRLLGPDERGELLVRGPMVMKGYLNNPGATRDIIDHDGWLHTGDIVYNNGQGDFFIVDRLKELIKYKGNQVPPAELEALLLQHPDVDDVGVVGIPDPEAGEIPRAFIVRRTGSSVSENELLKYVADHVASYKRLRGGVQFVDQIPKIGSGKILRSKLKRLVAVGHSKL